MNTAYRKLSLWQKYMISRELTGRKMVPFAKIQKMIVRAPPENYLNRLHPRTKLKYNLRLKKPEPLEFKLQDYNPNAAYEPIGIKQDIPFGIYRTKVGNLPVYTSYKHQHNQKFTEVRLITGNVEALKKELVKITSHSEIRVKTGKLVISGSHAEKVKLYLSRLGF